MNMTDKFSNQKKTHITQPLYTLKVITISVIIGFIGLISFGCNEGGTSAENVTGTSSTLIEGIFVDSPVEGLDYRTDTTSGITDENGRFICYSDEMITFMIGDVILGQAMAGEIISPMDFPDANRL